MNTRKWKLAIVMVLFGLIAGGLLAELGLRIAGPKWLKDYMRGTNLYGALQYGSDAGWPVETLNHKFVRFKRNQTFNVNYFEYKTTVHTDPWGGRSVAGEKNGTKLKIPFVGDSFTFGLGVEDTQTYVSLISNHAKWTPLNLGVPGSALPNQLDIIEFRHRELNSPKLYIFSFFLGNDVTDIMKYYGFKTETSFEDSRRPRVTDFVTRNRFLARSYLLQMIDLLTVQDQPDENTPESGKKASTRRSWNFRTPSGKRIGSSIFLMMSGSKGYHVTADRYLKLAFDRLSELEKSMRFKSYFVIIPEKHQVETDTLTSQARHYGLTLEELDRELPDKMIEAFFKERNIGYIDTLPCLMNRKGMYYRFDDHLTAAGHAAVAACIDQNVNEEILSLYPEQ